MKYFVVIRKLFSLANNKMTSNNNMGSQNKLDKLEEKKKLELQLLKINYDLSSNEVTIKKIKT